MPDELNWDVGLDENLYEFWNQKMNKYFKSEYQDEHGLLLDDLTDERISFQQFVDKIICLAKKRGNKDYKINQIEEHLQELKKFVRLPSLRGHTILEQEEKNAQSLS